MKALQLIVCWTVTASAATLMTPQALAQVGDSNKVTEQEEKVLHDLVNAQKAKVRQTLAVMNARQIGLALFEFETEYGAFPDEKTAAKVKENKGSTAELKAVTANDCFFQMVAAEIVQTDHIFTLKDPAAPERPEKKKALEKVVECFFSYMSGMTASGNPARPLVVAPLVKGKTTFDPQVLGGKAVVLRVDNSVQSFPIEQDGRVLINGKDIFDPDQPFWNGKVPPIKWPAK